MLLYRHYMDFDGNAQVLGMHIEWNFAEKNWSPFQNQCFHVLYAGLRLKVFKTPSACSGGNSVGEVGKRFSSPIIRIATPDEKSCRLFLLRMVQDLQVAIDHQREKARPTGPKLRKMSWALLLSLLFTFLALLPNIILLAANQAQ